MLEIGTVTPDIALEDTTGQPVRLADYRGRLNVLVYFMRSATCPVCNRHVKNLADHHAEYAARQVQILIAIPEGRDEAAEWAAKRQLPFPVVTGRRGSPHEAVGLMKRVFGSMQQSGTLLIDRTGIVRHAHAATMPTNSYDKRAIDRALESSTTIGR